MNKLAEKFAGAAFVAASLYCWSKGWEVSGNWLMLAGVITLL